MRRIVIFDIDLHHGKHDIIVLLYIFLSINLKPGNGTQRRVMEYPGYYNRVKYFYGGIYDPTSYPCNVSDFLARENITNTDC